MKNEEKKENLEELYKEYEEVKKEMRPIGEALGWYDEHGSTQPLDYRVRGEMNEEEEKEALERETIGQEIEFLKLQMKRNRIAKQIVKLEDELGIPMEESKAKVGW